MKKTRLIIVMLLVTTTIATLWAQRRITPVENKNTTTQAINEFRDDTAYINKQKREKMIHYHDDQGRIIYLDTITGEEWIDSTAMKKPQIEFPLISDVSIGVDIWDPVMRCLGQKYGLIGFWGEVSLWNRINPIFEMGFGQSSASPSAMEFTYKVPIVPYFKLGVNYNFLYKQLPEYIFYAGVRYGFTSFNYSIKDAVLENNYWDEKVEFEVPTQNSFVGWWELNFGLRVKIWKDFSAGWTFRYRHIMHQTKNPYGDPWYIPGYGTTNSSITGAFSISYTIPIGKPKIPQALQDEMDKKANPSKKKGSSTRPQPQPQPQRTPTEDVYPSPLNTQPETEQAQPTVVPEEDLPLFNPFGILNQEEEPEQPQAPMIDPLGQSGSGNNGVQENK